MEGMENARTGSRRKELTAPCKGCDRKTPGCHDGCGTYQAYREVVAQKNAYLRRTDRPRWDRAAGGWRREL